MAAYAEIRTSSGAELTASNAVVTSLNGGASVFDYAEVLRVEQSGGITPGKAWVCVRNLAAADETGNITLSSGVLSPKNLKFWSRVKITLNGVCLFVGALMKRRENLGGNSVVLEFWDDRWLLSKIPLRGALVYDNYTLGFKFLPRYAPHVNPGGMRNCTQVTKDLFVFTELAERGTKTLVNDQEVGNESNPAAGQAIYWTADRFLKYLRYFSQFIPPAGYIPGFSSLDTTKCQWTADSTAFQDGVLRRMMPDINFQGMRILKALEKTLDVSGNFELGCDYSDGATSNIYFYNRIKLIDPLTQATKTGKYITLQRSGPATDIRTIYDGTAETDASELCTGVLVEGAPPKIESEFVYTNTPGADQIVPCWSSTEQTAFLKIIQTGNDPAGNPLPGNPGPNTQQALQAARQCYPKVYKAFQFQGTALATILNGPIGAGGVGQLSQFPALLDFKTPLHEQLQPYFEDTNAPGVQRGRLRIPIRIQISAAAGDTTNYHDVTFNSGLRIGNDGIFWLDGLTDDIPNQMPAPTDTIYDNSILNYTGGTQPPLRNFKINCAIPHDTRTFATIDIFKDGVDPNNIKDQIDPSLNLTNGPALQYYVLSEDGFQKEFQVSSNPVLPNSFQTSDGKSPPSLALVSSNINGTIFDDSQQLIAHAKRQHYDQARLKRTSTWKMPGIRIDYSIGDFISGIQFYDSGVPGDVYVINAPLKRITFDFTRQDTGVEPE